MGYLLDQMEKTAAYAALASQYSDKWEDEAAMDELEEKVEALAKARKEKVTAKDLLPVIELVRKKENQRQASLAPLGSIMGGLAGGTAGSLLGGLGGAAIAKGFDMSRDSSGKAALAGIALGGLLGGAAGAKLMKGTGSYPYSGDEDAAEDWAYDINKYMES